MHQSDWLGHLRICQSVSVRWMQAGHLSFVICCSFDPLRVLAGWKMVVGKFDNEDLGAVLQGVRGFV